MLAVQKFLTVFAFYILTKLCFGERCCRTHCKLSSLQIPVREDVGKLFKSWFALVYFKFSLLFQSSHCTFKVEFVKYDGVFSTLLKIKGLNKERVLRSIYIFDFGVCFDFCHKSHFASLTNASADVVDPGTC